MNALKSVVDEKIFLKGSSLEIGLDITRCHGSYIMPASTVKGATLCNWANVGIRSLWPKLWTSATFNDPDGQRYAILVPRRTPFASPLKSESSRLCVRFFRNCVLRNSFIPSYGPTSAPRNYETRATNVILCLEATETRRSPVCKSERLGELWTRV